MGFLAPSILLGLVAAALPYLVHRLGKRPVRPVRFAAMALLLGAEREVAARRRLREIALLLVRTGLAAALPLVIARPFATTRSDAPLALGHPQSAVILLDDSASMTRRHGGGTVFDEARRRARELAVGLTPDSTAALLLAADGPETPLPDLGTDRTRLLGALDAARPSAAPADVAGALRRAASLLAGADHKERHVYFVTDGQAAGWDGAESAEAPGLVVLDVGAPGPLRNRAVVDLVVEAAEEAGGNGVAITAEIAAFGPDAAPNLGIGLRIDGAEVARGFVDVPAGGRARKRFLHRGAGAGAHTVEVVLDGDDLALDDRRGARIELARGLRILLVDGDARTVRNEDEVFFLEAALRAGGAFQVATVLPDDLAALPLTGTAVVFLANVARPSVEAAAALGRFVREGGGLFVSMGERIDVETWNARLGALLPLPLEMARTAAAGPGAAREGETVDLRPAERLAPLDRGHPLLAAFPTQGEGLGSARFFKYQLLAPGPETATRRVVLRYETGAPALVEAEVGKGRVLLLTSTLDREWTDLPIRPGFLPLIQEAARRLGGVPGREAARAVLVGRATTLAVHPEDRRLEITRPDGAIKVIRGESLAGHKSVVFSETSAPGLYEVRAAGPTGAIVERPEDSFYVDVDPRESDPARLPKDRTPGARATPDDGPGAPTRRVELWHALAAALVVLVLIESALGLRARRA